MKLAFMYVEPSSPVSLNFTAEWGSWMSEGREGREEGKDKTRERGGEGRRGEDRTRGGRGGEERGGPNKRGKERDGTKRLGGAI